MPLIEPFHIPEKGIWDALGLSRCQFLGILIFSVMVFLFLGGPAWYSIKGAHTVRIAVSYFVIPVLVTGAQWHNHALRFRSWIEASWRDSQMCARSVRTQRRAAIRPLRALRD